MSTVTLTEFLLARIADDESFALSAQALASNYDDAKWHWIVAHRMGSLWHPTTSTPDRVLAECEAKRRIIEDHEHDLSGTYGDKPGCWRCHQDRDYGLIPEGWCLTLRDLALPYAEHPDYREEWRP